MWLIRLAFLKDCGIKWCLKCGLGPAALALSGNLLKCESFGPYPRPAEPKLGLGPNSLFFFLTRPPGDSGACSSVGNTGQM